MAFVESFYVTLDTDAELVGHVEAPRSRLPLIARLLATENARLTTDAGRPRVVADGGTEPVATAAIRPA
ncbi:hypothetical protein [Halomarina oriensis]|uniref:Uncharacterized protein n=1 Tax=Halomarina oriensis TaxID=671145 RepID=A0A6B0GI59_9EURY|nr:hypothetical protein [Halomarina oriensis]MWG33119.1 hypothetical protein [Halomarina oriensis]